MILHIPNLLSLDELNHCRQTLNQAEWVDGKMTTGHQSAYLKNNLQLAQDSQEALQLGQIIQQAANSNPLFFRKEDKCKFCHIIRFQTESLSTGATRQVILLSLV